MTDLTPDQLRTLREVAAQSGDPALWGIEWTDTVFDLWHAGLVQHGQWSGQGGGLILTPAGRAALAEDNAGRADEPTDDDEVPL